jgi:hypothetical protein
MNFDEKYIERFWEKVNIRGEDDCWEWLNYKSPDGYGRTRYPNGGNMTLTSRIVYILTFGDVLDNMRVLHTCDNRGCCNPKHLFLGTQTDNIHDMENKNRAVHLPEKKKIDKLTIVEIRNKYNKRINTQQELSLEYGLCLQCIRNMVIGKTHKNVGGPITIANRGFNQYNYKNRSI